MIHAYKIALDPGVAIILLWNDEEHLEKWEKVTATSTESLSEVRQVKIPIEHVPELKTPPNVNREKATIVAVGISKRPDYSDCRVMYHMTVGKK